MRIVHRAFTLLTVAVAAVIAQDCDLECETSKDNTQTNTDGTLKCVQAPADFTDHELPNGQVLAIHESKVSPEGYHCVCNDGWTGLVCRRKYETCSDIKTANNHCYHNGKCEDGEVDGFDNPKSFCDCLHAQDQNGTKHIGKYCEIPVTACKERPLENLFCLNDGVCKSNAKDNPLEAPCTCGSDFDGPHCEFTTPVSDQKCELRCENGGKCIRGFKDFHQAALQFGQIGLFTENDYQYCECPEGTEGVRCEHKTTVDGQEVCGERFPCQNGGNCVNTVDETTGDTKDQCDCTNAKNATHRFGGKFCQHASTSFCSQNVDQNGKPFCVNGGTCKEGGSHMGCECKPGFTGDICDIILDGSSETNTEAEEAAKCELDCGSGNCRKGVKDLSLLDGFGSELAHIANETNEDFEHCVCPTGLVGPRCEFKVEVCGNGEHLCLHGSKCVRKNDKQACDCDTFDGVAQIAGAFCQHEASVFCTEDNNPETGGQAIKAFCVNGGTCKGKIKKDDRKAKHPGCKCLDGFEGEHCEFKVGSEFNPNTQSSGSSSSGDDGGLSTAGIWAVSFTAVALVAAFAAFLFMKTRRTGKRSAKSLEYGSGNGTPAPAPVLNMGPDKDADGNEVTDVEII